MISGRPGSCWLWSDRPEAALMRAQLTDHRAKGFGRIYMKARPSMALGPHLSEAYLAAYAEELGIMAELGLQAGICDDDAWTSGHAGGPKVAGPIRGSSTIFCPRPGRVSSPKGWCPMPAP